MDYAWLRFLVAAEFLQNPFNILLCKIVAAVMAGIVYVDTGEVECVCHHGRVTVVRLSVFPYERVAVYRRLPDLYLRIRFCVCSPLERILFDGCSID